jgi:hypothetical protein
MNKACWRLVETNGDCTRRLRDSSYRLRPAAGPWVPSSPHPFTALCVGSITGRYPGAKRTCPLAVRPLYASPTNARSRLTSRGRACDAPPPSKTANQWPAPLFRWGRASPSSGATVPTPPPGSSSSAATHREPEGQSARPSPRLRHRRFRPQHVVQRHHPQHLSARPVHQHHHQRI